MFRELIAYGLLVVLLIGAALTIAWLRYNSAERVYRRRVLREQEEHRARLARKAAEEGRASPANPAPRQSNPRQMPRT